MPKMESLGYLLRPDIDRTEFTTFIKFGLRGPDGKYLIDPSTGSDIRGVLNWLRGNQVFEGNFYIDPGPGFGMLVVVRQADPPEVWRIAGLDRFVRKSSTVSICANNKGIIEGDGAEFLLEPRPDIDSLLSSRREAFEAVPPPRRDELNRALRGEKGTDLDAILREFGLFDFVNPV
jgi:hypothetical protein